MKKLIAAVLAAALLIALAACGSAVAIGGFSSIYLDSEDYDAAVDIVVDTFKEYEGCTLKKVGYAGDEAVKAEAEARGLAPEQVIVLTSVFSTDGKDHGTVFEPNRTYEDYRWILTREEFFGPFWEIADRGFN